MICSDCSRQFKTPGGLARHRAAAHPPPTGRFYFCAADVTIEVDGQRVASFKEISYDSTKDAAPRVRTGTITGTVEDPARMLERVR